MLLLTGSSGLIGRELLITLLKNGMAPKDIVCPHFSNFPITPKEREKWPINLFYCDLKQERDIQLLFSAFPEIDKIIHLAALASPSSNDFETFYDLNLKGTHYLLENCNQGTDFLFASSVTYYGDNGCFYEADRPNPKSLYAITKVACEQLINLYFWRGKIRPRILRFCGNVGPELTHGRIKEAMDGATEIKLKGKAPGNYGPLCHIEDTVKAILAAMTCNKPSMTINVCPEDYISLEDCLKLVNPNIKLTWDGVGEPNVLQVDNCKARIEFNWSPRYNSREALLEVLKSRKNNKG